VTNHGKHLYYGIYSLKCTLTLLKLHNHPTVKFVNSTLKNTKLNFVHQAPVVATFM